MVRLSLTFSIGKVNWLKVKAGVQSVGAQGPLPATILQTMTLDHMPWDKGSTVSSSWWVWKRLPESSWLLARRSWVVASTQWTHSRKVNTGNSQIPTHTSKVLPLSWVGASTHSRLILLAQYRANKLGPDSAKAWAGIGRKLRKWGQANIHVCLSRERIHRKEDLLLSGCWTLSG